MLDSSNKYQASPQKRDHQKRGQIYETSPGVQYAPWAHNYSHSPLPSIKFHKGCLCQRLFDSSFKHVMTPLILHIIRTASIWWLLHYDLRCTWGTTNLQRHDCTWTAVCMNSGSDVDNNIYSTFLAIPILFWQTILASSLRVSSYVCVSWNIQACGEWLIPGHEHHSWKRYAAPSLILYLFTSLQRLSSLQHSVNLPSETQMPMIRVCFQVQIWSRRFKIWGRRWELGIFTTNLLRNSRDLGGLFPSSQFPPNLNLITVLHIIWQYHLAFAGRGYWD